ncbi:MAG TPA: DUF2723 domain-containing protein [Candidatus Acidoferrales bacterium]|nr:DUF2723 domain-containing protein [Candidatus Acidoferrales bacterium]
MTGARLYAALAGLARAACDVAAFAVPAAVYVASVSHQPGSWDTAELQGVPYILGITHPTGFPLYVLLGYVWTHVLAIDTVAFRANVMSAIAISGVCAAAYAIARELGARRPVALAATLWFSLTQDVWSHAIRAEAQDLAVLLEALAIWAFVRWLRGTGDRWYFAAFALTGLAMAAHPNALWVVPGLIFGSIVARRRPALRLAALSAAACALALSLYLYLPLRSAYVVSHGLDPTMGLAGTDGGIFWNYRDPSTPHGLLLDLTGDETNVTHYLFSSFTPAHVQDALWALITLLGTQYGAFALVLIATGIALAWRRDSRVTAFLFVACTAALLFSVTYSEEGDVGRYRLLALMLAVPAIGAIVPERARGFRAYAGAVALALFSFAGAAVSLQANLEFFRHSPDENGRWVINAVRPYVPPGGVILAGWLDATSLAYGAYVDGSLPGRIVVSGAADANRQNYPLWARTHPVFILVNPRDVASLPNAKLVTIIDAYHALWRAEPG